MLALQRQINELTQKGAKTDDKTEKLAKTQNDAAKNIQEKLEKMEQVTRFQSLLRKYGLSPDLIRDDMYPCIIVSEEVVASRPKLAAAAFTALMSIFNINSAQIVYTSDISPVDMRRVNDVFASLTARIKTGEFAKGSVIKRTLINALSGENIPVCSCCGKPLEDLGTAHRYVAILRDKVDTANREKIGTNNVEALDEKGVSLEARTNSPYLYVCLEAKEQRFFKAAFDISNAQNSAFPCLTFFIDTRESGAPPELCFRGKRDPYLDHQTRLIQGLTSEAKQLRALICRRPKETKLLKPAASPKTVSIAPPTAKNIKSQSDLHADSSNPRSDEEADFDASENYSNEPIAPKDDE